MLWIPQSSSFLHPVIVVSERWILDIGVVQCAPAQPSPLLSSIVPPNLCPAISRPELWPVPVARPQRNSIRSQSPAPSPSAVSRCPVRRASDNLPLMASPHIVQHTPDQRCPALDIKTFTYLILTESWGHWVTLGDPVLQCWVRCVGDKHWSMETR